MPKKHGKSISYARNRASRKARIRTMRAKNARRFGRGTGPRKNYLSKYNGEVKSIEVNTPSPQSLQTNVGSVTNGPGNSLLFLPTFFNVGGSATKLEHGLENDANVVGRWITMAYPTKHKFVLNYEGLTVPSSGSCPSLNIRCLTGCVKITGDKINATLTNSQAGWRTAIRSAVLAELYESGYDADHLSFKQLNRNIKIYKNFKIRPKNSQFISFQVDASTILTPDSQVTVSYPHPRFKTRLEPVEDDRGAPDGLVPNNIWVPFTLFMCPELESTMGEVIITDNSKSWYRDN